MKYIASTSLDPLLSPEYTVTVNGCPITVHGAKSCKPPFPFKVFKAGEHPDVRLARPGAAAGPAQIAEAGNAPYAFASFPAEGPVEVMITSALPMDIEDITVHLDEDRHGKDFIKIEPLLTPFVKRDTLGSLQNLTFRNITCLGPWEPRICIWGKDEEHDVKHVKFDNLTINGRPVDALYPGLSIGEHTRDITF